MPVEKGSAFLLKVGNGAAPVVYATVAGLKTTWQHLVKTSLSVRA